MQHYYACSINGCAVDSTLIRRRTACVIVIACTGIRWENGRGGRRRS